MEVSRVDRRLPELEVLAEPDRNPADVHPRVLLVRDVRPDDVAGPKSLRELLPRGVADREPVRVGPATVSFAVSARLGDLPNGTPEG